MKSEIMKGIEIGIKQEVQRRWQKDLEDLKKLLFTIRHNTPFHLHLHFERNEELGKSWKEFHSLVEKIPGLIYKHKKDEYIIRDEAKSCSEAISALENQVAVEYVSESLRQVKKEKEESVDKEV